MQTREKLWEIIYLQLLSIMYKVGLNDAFGEGDYWVVDDDWGTEQHKICIFRVSKLTPRLIDDLQNVLIKFAFNWEIIISLEAQGIPQSGITIKAQEVRYDWDLAKIRQILGKPDFFITA